MAHEAVRTRLLKILLAAVAALSLAPSCASGAFVSIEGAANFNSVSPGFSLTHTFTVKNSGAAAATLGDISSTGLGLSAPFSFAGGTCSTGFTLAPDGGTCTLQIKFSPSIAGGASTTLKVSHSYTDTRDGVFHTSISFLQLYGNGGDPIEVQRSAIDFGPVEVGFAASSGTTIINRGAPAVVLGDVSAEALGLNGAFTSFRSTCATGQILDADGGSCFIGILFTPSAATAYTQSVQIPYHYVGESQTRIATFSLSGQGAILSVTMAAEGGDNFGAVLPGSSKAKTFTVTNQSTIDATLLTFFDPQSPFARTGGTCVLPRILAPGASCTVVVTFSPTQTGTANGRLDINYDVRSEGRFVRRDFYGYGGTPISFDDLRIGPQPLGATIVKPVTLTNHHTSAVTLGSISAAALQLGASFTLSGGSCTTSAVLAADGGTCKLLLSFAPTNLGDASQRIGVSYSWNDGGNRSATTSGDLIASGVAVRPIKQVVTGDTFSCALFADGGVRCWGLSPTLALGHPITDEVGDDEYPSTLGDVNVGKVVQLTAGGDVGPSGAEVACALLDTGNVHCWGSYWMLGVPNISVIDGNPAGYGDVNVGGPVRQVDTSGHRTCALLTNGKVRCWGGSWDESGNVAPLGYATSELYIGDNEPPASMGDIDLGGSAVQISNGFAHTCAVLTTGNVRCWGSGLYGRLGYGSDDLLYVGNEIPPSAAGDVNVGAPVVKVAAGRSHTCALLTTGNVRCWGDGAAGELGYGNTETIGDDETPASAGDVNIGGTAVDITAGDEYTCALLDTGKTRCWGKAGAALGYGQLRTIGDDELPSSSGTVNVGGDVLQVDAAKSHTCAVLTKGTVRCWGDDYLGYPHVTAPLGDDELPLTAGDLSVQ